MSTNVVALVEGASVPIPDVADLWGIYKGYAGRSLAERRHVKRALAYVKGENVIDLRALFALPEAFREDGLPAVAIAPMKWVDVGYTRWMAGEQGGFHRTDPSWHTLNEFHIIRINAPDHASITHRAVARVPLTPKYVAPWNPLTRRKCFVLFDADWKVLPVDPYLLYRVNDHQFKVLAHWNLTPKERQIMALIQ